MEFKGTKGKWCYAENSQYCEVRCINDDRYLSTNVILHEKSICSLTPISLSDENKSNAKLMSCAPELLQMLQYLYVTGFKVDLEKSKEIKELITKATTI